MTKSQAASAAKRACADAIAQLLDESEFDDAIRAEVLRVHERLERACGKLEARLRAAALRNAERLRKRAMELELAAGNRTEAVS